MTSTTSGKRPPPRLQIAVRTGVIYDTCKALNLSRDALSREMGVATQTAYRVDSGAVSPSPGFIAALMDVTGRPFEELFEIVETNRAAA